MKIRISYFTLFFLSFFFINSCVSVQVDPDDPDAHLIKGVKMIYQGQMQCTAACLAMVLQYYNVDTSMSRIDREIRPKGGRVGCGPLRDFPIAHGFKTESFLTSDPEKLKEYLSKDIPLIAIVKSEGPVGCHNVVIVGYTGKGFIINDPYRGRCFKTYDAFRKWHFCQLRFCGPYWALAIYR